MIEQTEKYGVSCWKLDGFALEPCENEKHDHLCGGKYDMYYVNEQWHRFVDVFKRYRASGEKAAQAWINLTCFVNPSPFWLQWVNSVWIQNSDDIGFAENQEDQSRLDAEITYRDARYYDAFVKRGYQFPLYAVYNHEPIYAKNAGGKKPLEYSDEEFERYLFWCAVRGAALNEMYLSPEMMNDEKCASLSKVMKFQRENYGILKNAQFIGGDPEENNVYCFVSFSKEGEGIIALRNPTDEEAPLTLTLNRLMGAPETLENVRRENVYCKSLAENDKVYSYNDKLSVTLHPFEMIIFKLTK